MMLEISGVELERALATTLKTVKASPKASRADLEFIYVVPVSKGLVVSSTDAITATRCFVNAEFPEGRDNLRNYSFSIHSEKAEDMIRYLKRENKRKTSGELKLSADAQTDGHNPIVVLNFANSFQETEVFRLVQKEGNRNLYSQILRICRTVKPVEFDENNEGLLFDPAHLLKGLGVQSYQKKDRVKIRLVNVSGAPGIRVSCGDWMESVSVGVKKDLNPGADRYLDETWKNEEPQG